VFKGLMLLT